MNSESSAVPFRWLNVVILALAVFHSGGVPIIEFYYLTTALGALVVLRFFLRGTLPTTALLLYSAAIAGLLFAHFVLSDRTQNPKLYVLYLGYAVIALAIVLHYMHSADDVATDFRDALVFFMVWSFAGFLLQFPFSDRIGTYAKGDYEALTFANLFFYPRFAEAEVPFLHNVYRSQGLFWEPGIQQIYMNALLFVALYCRPSRWMAWGAIAAVLLTVSTAGYVVLLYVAGPWLIGVVRRRPAFAPLTIALAAVLVVAAMINWTEKVHGSGSRSAQARETDFRVGMELFREYPWAGIGLSRERMHDLSAMSYLQSQGGPLKPEEVEKFKGFTSSLVYLTCGLGLFGAVLFVVCFYRQQLLPEWPLYWLGMVMLCAVSEPILNTPLFLMFPVSGLTTLLMPRAVGLPAAQRALLDRG